MGSTGIEAFPEPPIYLHNDQTISPDQTWPTGSITPGSISPLSESPAFGEGPAFCNMRQLVDDITAEFPLHQEHYGLNPIVRFQVEAENAPFGQMAAPQLCDYTNVFSACSMKVEPQQLHLRHLADSYRHASPVGSDSGYSGGGTFSSAGSERHQASPRASIGSQHSVSQQWYSSPSYPMRSPEPTTGAGTVSMGLIQQFADETEQSPEPDAPFEPEDTTYPTGYGLYVSPGFNAEDTMTFQSGADNGYSVAAEVKASPGSVIKDEEDQDTEGEDPTFKPSSRGRKPRTASLAGVPMLNRRSTGLRRQSAPTLAAQHATSKIKKPRGKGRKAGQGDAPQAFPCPLAIYGCPSRFSAKNEWKRHISTQHVKTDMWRCDQCPASLDPANPSHNDFNRKDLFTQHLRRMHAPEDPDAKPTMASLKGKAVSALSDEDVNDSVTRCHMRIRDTPLHSTCVVCDKTFRGPGSWEDRIEHIASVHFEKDKKAGSKTAMALTSWRRDPVLEQWLVDEGLIEHDTKGGWRLGNGTPRRPQHTFS